MATRKTTAKAPTTTSKAPKKAPAEPVKAQEQVQEQTTAPMPTIRAKIDRLADFENSKVKAFASANIGPFAVHGLRVVDGEKGMFVAMPSTSYQKDGKTEYQETFHPVSGEARKALNDAVLQAYEQKLAEEQTEEQTEDETLEMDEAEDQPLTQTM